MAAPAKAPRKASNKARTLASIKSLDPDDDERTTISKKISWILRHGVPKNYIENEDGWVKITDLLKAEILEGVPRETIDKVIIDSNSKKLRYQLSPDNLKIKAYSKGERKALTDRDEAPEPLEKGVSLRADATEFVPNHGAAGAAAGLQMGGYPWPYGLGMNPLMPYPYGLGGVAGLLGAAGRVPPGPPVAAALPAGKYRGKIKSFNPDKGFGFIDCPQAHAQYSRDVFVHKAQVGDLKVGADVIFSVETNKQGMPQAKEVTPASGMLTGFGLLDALSQIKPKRGPPAGGKGKKGGKDGGKAAGKGKTAKGESKGKSKGEGKGKKAKGEKKEEKAEGEAADTEPKAEEKAEAVTEEKNEEPAAA